MSQKKVTKKSVRTRKSKSKKIEKLDKLTQTNGRVYEDEDTNKTRKLEEILEVAVTNPFGTSSQKVFEENLANMNLSEMQEVAVRAGIFPSGNQTMLKNKLKKAFKAANPDQLQVIIDKGPPIELNPKNPKHKQLIDYLNS
tara:strand:+ start:9955 stop:10377 length:423 start_codon:yes stop_codon:yes gene_type:complete